MRTFADLTKAEAAAAFGVSIPAVEAWIRKGFPARKVNSRWVINLPEAIVWRINDLLPATDREGGTLEEEQTRLTRAKADLAELELSESRGELVRIAATTAEWEGAVSRCRSRLLALPVKAAPQVVGCNNIAEVKGLLDGFVTEALEELTSDSGNNRAGDDTGGAVECDIAVPSSAAPLP